MRTALACDGPRNGQYIDAGTAREAGYELAFWPTGEKVWMQFSVLVTQFDYLGVPL